LVSQPNLTDGLSTMPISGPVATQQIQQAYREAKSALAAARAASQQAGHALQQVSDAQRETLGDLAKHYLPELTPAAAEGTWSEIREAVRSVLRRQAERVEQLQGELETHETEHERRDAAVAATTEALDAALDRQHSLAEQLAQRLSSDAAFRTLTQRAAEAEAALERAEASLEEVEHEASQKLPAFEQSKLFTYLYERGLATPRYSSRGLTRRIDRWVGKLIDYPKAKESYEYLKSTPEQVRRLVAEDRAALTTVMEEVERQRDQVAEELGLPAAIDQAEAAEEAHQRAIDQLDEIDRQLEQVRGHLSQAQDPHGPFYEEAIEHFRGLLKDRDRDDLAYEASRTADPRDDQIVARLETIDAQIRSANTDAIARQQRIQWLDRYLGELGHFLQRFRAANFDSSRSTFDASLNLAHELAMVREGRETFENVWRRLRHRQRFVASTYEQIGGGLSSAARNPMTQVLVSAMAQSATHALSNHARRAGQRHGSRSRRSSRSAARPRQTRPGGFYTSRRI
jgi:chromosome segregation ATPase